MSSTAKQISQQTNAMSLRCFVRTSNFYGIAITISSYNNLLSGKTKVSCGLLRPLDVAYFH